LRDYLNHILLAIQRIEIYTNTVENELPRLHSKVEEIIRKLP